MILNWDLFYMFPTAIVVCILASSSGFSGSVLFQPVFYFIAKVPLGQSIATGIATETIGMTTGALTYFTMKNKSSSQGHSTRIDSKALRSVLPYVIGGVFAGYLVFLKSPQPILRMLVGVVITSVAIYQLKLAKDNRLGKATKASLDVLKKPESRIYQFLAGIFSASTGTGVAEMHQPLFEHKAHLGTLQANATAICVEAIADWVITFCNLKIGNIRYDILIFTVSGVLVGGQIGPRLAKYIPPRTAKLIFGTAVTLIGLTYIFRSFPEVVKLAVSL